MKITNKTKTANILPLLDENRLKELIEQIPSYPLEKSIMSMSIKQFSDILTDEETFIKKLLSHKRALVAFGKLKSYKEQIDRIAKFMKLYDYKRSQDEEQATNGVVFPDFSIRMLADCVKFFHLKSFDEAESCKVSDWLTIFQIEAANSLFQHNYNKIVEDKQKRKQKK